MSELIPITQTDDGRQAVSGRALHGFLGPKARYNDWFPRMVEYGFTEGQDYVLTSEYVPGANGREYEQQNHILTLDMAKEVSMIQRNEKGRQARQYFLECERRAKDPQPMSELDEARIVQRAIQVQYQKIQELEARELENAPKVAYHDDFVCTEDLLRFSTVASTIGITEKQLRQLLCSHGWIYKEEATRRSRTGEKKTVYRYSEYADKKRYFQRQEVHDAPRFRGEVMHTLKVTPDGATAIVRAVKRWTAGESIPEIEGVPVEDAAADEIPPAD